MKHLHKFASVLLALVMALSLMVPAFASEGEPNPAPQETATLTVPDLSNHSYTAYQIFSGTQAESEGALADVQWGSGIDSTSFLAKLVALGYKEIGSDDTEKAVFTESMTAADLLLPKLLRVLLSMPAKVRRLMPLHRRLTRLERRSLMMLGLSWGRKRSLIPVIM